MKKTSKNKGNFNISHLRLGKKTVACFTLNDRRVNIGEKTAVEAKLQKTNSESKILHMNATLEMTASTPAAGAAKRKILLVDDDAGIRQILVRLLAEEDFIVLTAANGLEALALSGSTQFDLVLLDLNMPVKDGWETFEQLSAQNPLMPVILITARPNQYFPAMSSGLGALLEKPLDFTKLFHTIHDLLEESDEMRLARLAGKSSTFSYVPPITGAHDRKAI